MRNAFQVAFHLVLPLAYFVLDLDVVAKRKRVFVETNLLFGFGEKSNNPGAAETLQVNHLIISLRPENTDQPFHFFPFPLLFIEGKHLVDSRMVFENGFIALPHQYIDFSFRVQAFQLTDHRGCQDDISQKSCLND